MYREDWIGLKRLDEAGKLKLMSVEVNFLPSLTLKIISLLTRAIIFDWTKTPLTRSLTHT